MIDHVPFQIALALSAFVGDEQYVPNAATKTSMPMMIL